MVKKLVFILLAILLLPTLLDSASNISYVPAYTSQYPLMQSDTYVKATSKNSTNFWQYFATNPTKSLVGPWSTAAWITPMSVITNQRFHIDLLTPKIVTRIYYENVHTSGSYTASGVKNFILQGSNSDASFSDTTYAINTGWDNITTDTTVMARHVAADTPDPKYIGVTNTTAYRYYALKFADNYGGGGGEYLGIRRIELQSGPDKRVISYTGTGDKRVISYSP